MRSSSHQPQLKAMGPGLRCCGFKHRYHVNWQKNAAPHTKNTMDQRLQPPPRAGVRWQGQPFPGASPTHPLLLQSVPGMQPPPALPRHRLWVPGRNRLHPSRASSGTGAQYGERGGRVGWEVRPRTQHSAKRRPRPAGGRGEGGGGARPGREEGQERRRGGGGAARQVRAGRGAAGLPGTRLALLVRRGPAELRARRRSGLAPANDSSRSPRPRRSGGPAG